MSPLIALASEPKPRAAHSMDNPFSQREPGQSAPEEGELATFLRWANTFANPFDAEFLQELAALYDQLQKMQTLPASLAEGRGVLVWLDMGMELFKTERTRLEKLYHEYDQRGQEMKERYSEEEAARWLEANMPQAYQRHLTMTRHLTPVTSTENPE